MKEKSLPFRLSSGASGALLQYMFAWLVKFKLNNLLIVEVFMEPPSPDCLTNDCLILAEREIDIYNDEALV